MEKLVIWGAGDLGKRAYHIIGDSNVVAFIDSAKEKCGKIYCGKEIIDLEKYCDQYSNYKIVISYTKEDEITSILDLKGISNYYRLQDCPGEFQQPAFGYKLESFVKSYISSNKEYIVCGNTMYSAMVSSWIYEIQGMYPKNINCLEEIQNEKPDSEIEILLTERIDDIPNVIKQLGVNLVDLYDCSDKISDYYNKAIENFQGACKGKRCFVIGNGPSLTIDDLNTLYMHHESCFAVNYIIKTFDKTAWRPDFFVSEDVNFLSEKTIDWNKLEIPYLFVADTNEEFWSNEYNDNIFRYHLVYERCVNKFPKFSEDFSRKSYMGCSVIYSCIQLAAYMGYEEIILLGVDFSYADNQDSIYRHFYKEKNLNSIGYTKEVTNAFISAKKYADKKGIKILNATRGGKLEIFKRVDFNSLFA